MSLKYIRYGNLIQHFKNINSLYFAIFLDNNLKKISVKRNRLTKQYGLRLRNY